MTLSLGATRILSISTYVVSLYGSGFRIDIEPSPGDIYAGKQSEKVQSWLTGFLSII